ncbi:MAG: helix-turn-helix transcriptional regulator [Leucobacter sp.]
MNGEAAQLLELFLIPAEVAAQLGVSVRKLRRMRKAGLGPAYFTIGSKIRYLSSDVDRWRAEHPDGVRIPRRFA